MIGAVNFKDVRVGDHIRFITNDNGYGGRGFYSRTGTVTATGPKSVTIRCENGTNARLRAAEWGAREPQKVAGSEPDRTPYDADHVAIVDMGHTVWALYIPDPEQARDPRAVADNILDHRYESVEVVATAQRYYKGNGADLSGWVTSSGGNSSEPYSNKREAMFSLGQNILSYFARTEQETETVTEPRYTVVSHTWSPFAVYDSVTKREVARFISRYAAQNKADRLNESEQSEAAREVAAILASSTTEQKCGHGRHLYKTLRAKSIPVCAEGAAYGVWDSNDAGFLHVVDCAQDAATWAMEQMDDEPDYELEILAVCREHTEQPAESCEECDEEGCGAVDADDMDSCGNCSDCSSN